MPYINAEIAARKLTQQDALPIDLAKVCKTCGVHLRSMRLAWYRAFFVYHAGQPVIVVNKILPKPEQRYGIARELGYFVMKHGETKTQNKKPIARPKQQVEEAQAFALELLIPKVLIARQGRPTPEQIAKTCEVPLEVAKAKAKKLGWI